MAVTVVRKSNASLYARLRAAYNTLNGAELRVGWFATNKYEDGTPVAYVAVIHEFGAPKAGIPPRPFMRPTIAREENNWRAFAEEESKAIVQGRSTAKEMLEKLGLNASGEIARTLSEVTTPALKPGTVAAKVRKMADKSTVGASDKPLVETGILLDTVTYTVKA